MGCLYRVLPSFSLDPVEFKFRECYRVLPSFTHTLSFYGNKLYSSSKDFYRVLPSFSLDPVGLPSFFSDFFRLIGFYRVLPSFTEFYQVLPIILDFGRGFLNQAEFYRVVPSYCGGF